MAVHSQSSHVFMCMRRCKYMRERPNRLQLMTLLSLLLQMRMSSLYPPAAMSAELVTTSIVLLLTPPSPPLMLTVRKHVQPMAYSPPQSVECGGESVVKLVRSAVCQRRTKSYKVVLRE